MADKKIIRVDKTPLSSSQASDFLEQVKSNQLSKQDQEAIKTLLPHRYGYKWYGWARAFYKSRSKQCFLVAANQVSKSSTQIRKMIEWATNDALWPKLWKTTPRVFFYLYPNINTATTEFDTKWVPEFMPRGAMKEHPLCGWKAHYERQKIYSVVFNSGVTIFFKSYSQNVQDLQAATVHYVAWDEEIPVEIYDELIMRISAVDGYMSGVFTATLGQEFFKQVMEGKDEDEKLPDAFKLQVSKYDCLVYEDGSPGAYTEEKIQREIRMCKSQTEVQRRIYGRFITELGRTYSEFEYEKHMIPPSSLEVPRHWSTYVGIDIGTGGLTGHPAAIVFIALNPLCTLGIIYDGWRGDGITTTSEDILNKYLEMKARNKVEPVQVWYDWHAKDFQIVASRAGIGLSRPDKSHELGEDILNTLFKNKMLLIYETEELRKLGNELSTLMRSARKQKAKDDFCDSLRYCAIGMPWDWNSIRSDAEVSTVHEKVIETRPLTHEEYMQWIECQRKKVPYDEIDRAENKGKDGWEEFEDELDEWDSTFDL